MHVPRQSLRALLCARLEEGTIRWSSNFDGVTTLTTAASAHDGDGDGGGVELSFNDGAWRVRADVLVGADGIRSKVRAAAAETSEDAER